MARAPTDKRERLIEAAIAAFHKRGVAGTSIADVARDAGVPPGNVFYYFKTKNELVAAVVTRWTEMVVGYADALAADSDPWKRIESFIEQAGKLRDMYTSLGCPLACILRDVHRDAPELAELASGIYAVQFRWLELQFASAGVSAADARRHARFLMSINHGAISLAYAQRDDTLIVDAVSMLQVWLTEIQKAQGARNS